MRYILFIALFTFAVEVNAQYTQYLFGRLQATTVVSPQATLTDGVSVAWDVEAVGQEVRLELADDDATTNITLSNFPDGHKARIAIVQEAVNGGELVQIGGVDADISGEPGMTTYLELYQDNGVTRFWDTSSSMQVVSAAPTSAECDQDTEGGRTMLDTTNFVFYACMGADGWYKLDLTAVP